MSKDREEEERRLQEEIGSAVEEPDQTIVSSISIPGPAIASSDPDFPSKNGKAGAKVQWSTSNMMDFYPIGRSVKTLIPGYYETDQNSEGYFLKKIDTSTEDLIKFPDGNEDEVINEIENFWKKEEEFVRTGLTYKRGILLWGPPGGGKTSTCRQLLKSVISLNGVCLKFNNPEYTKKGIRFIKEIQKKIPLIVLLEDLDSLFDMFEESEILQLLDGLEDVHNTVFIATSNYPNKLKPRVVNRPSRFDKRYLIDYPSKESRKIYLEHLINKHQNCEIDVDKWVRDTDQFTVSHIKELFISVILFENNYEAVIKTLKNMKEKMIDKDKLNKMGFSS